MRLLTWLAMLALSAMAIPAGERSLLEGRLDYTAIGTVVNQAARLCGEAKPGEILVTQRVFSAVQGAIGGEPLGELSLNGLGQAVASLRLMRGG